MHIKTIQTSNKNFILKYFRCRDGKRTETRIGMEGICITHSCIPSLLAIMCCMYTVYSGMQEWVIQIPSIPILVSVLFPSLHLKYFRIKFLLLVYKAIESCQQIASTKLKPFFNPAHFFLLCMHFHMWGKQANKKREQEKYTLL